MTALREAVGAVTRGDVALAVGAALCALLLLHVLSLYVLHPQRLRGPRPLPLLYNFVEVRRNLPRILDWALANSLTYGKVWSVRLPLMPPLVVVCDPRSVQQMLESKFENYVKGEFTHVIGKPLLGDGIFNVDGELWLQQRKTASHIFSVRALATMVPTFVSHARKVVSKLRDAAGAERVLDMQHLYYCNTLDCIGEIAMGRDIRSLDGLDEGFAEAFDTAQQCTEERCFNPFWKVMPELALKRAVRTLNIFAKKVIDGHDKAPESVRAATDLLARFLEKTDEHGRPFSAEYLRDIVMNLIIAGRDTTAQTLTWTTYLLSQHPDVEAKMVAEIDAVLGGGAEFDMRLANELVYTKAVINETLRLYPPVPLDPKCALADDVLPTGDRVPAGSWVIWSAWCLGRHPDLWREPERFLPERWTTMSATHGPVHPYAFIPFQEGRRRCLGRDMAYLEARCVLAHVYAEFSFRLPAGRRVTYKKPAITLPVKDGLSMHVLRRAAA